MGYKSFEELEVWKRGCNLVVPVHKCKNVKRGASRDLIRGAGQIRFSFAVHAPHGRTTPRWGNFSLDISPTFGYNKRHWAILERQLCCR